MFELSAHRGLFAFLVLALLATAWASMMSGSLPIDMRESSIILLDSLGLGEGAEQLEDFELKRSVLLQIRLPRIVLAIITGLSLAVSGAVMQGLFRNPLADPGLMGISAGCAFGAALFSVIGAAWLAGVSGLLLVWALPAAAFLGGLLSTWLVFFLGRRGQRTDVATM